MTLPTFNCVKADLRTLDMQIECMNQAISRLITVRTAIVDASENLYTSEEAENQKKCVNAIIDSISDAKDMMAVKYRKIAKDAVLSADAGPNALAMYRDPCEIACKYCKNYIDSDSIEDESGHTVLKVLCDLTEGDEFITAPIGCKGFDMAVKQPSDCDKCVRRKGCWALDQHPRNCTSYEEVSQ